MEINQQLDFLVEVCHRLHATGKVSGSGGNVSMLIDGEVYITPSGVSLGDVRRNNLVRLHSDGTYDGEIKPSKESILHLNCYKNRSDITSVVHVHSLYSVALSCILKPGDTVPVFFPGYAMRVGYLPLIPYLKPGCRELAEAVGENVKTRNSVMLCNHGIITVGASMEQALNIMEEIEENAQLYFVINGRGRALNEEQVLELNPNPYKQQL